MGFQVPSGRWGFKTAQLQERARAKREKENRPWERALALMNLGGTHGISLWQAKIAGDAQKAKAISDKISADAETRKAEASILSAEAHKIAAGSPMKVWEATEEAYQGQWGGKYGPEDPIEPGETRQKGTIVHSMAPERKTVVRTGPSSTKQSSRDINSNENKYIHVLKSLKAAVESGYVNKGHFRDLQLQRVRLEGWLMASKPNFNPILIQETVNAESPDPSLINHYANLRIGEATGVSPERISPASNKKDMVVMGQAAAVVSGKGSIDEKGNFVSSIIRPDAVSTDWRFNLHALEEEIERRHKINPHVDKNIIKSRVINEYRESVNVIQTGGGGGGGEESMTDVRAGLQSGIDKAMKAAR